MSNYSHRELVRYFFHLETNPESYPDELGDIFPNHEAALEHAAAIARDLAVEQDLRGAIVRGVDERKREVGVIKIGSP